jgi:hypothetical protein
MRRFVTTKWLAVGALALAALLTAVAVLISRTAAEPAKVFLAPNADIAAKVEVDDPAHFLGEPFPVAIVVQFRPKSILLEPDSLRRLSFAPFEPTGVVFLNVRKIDEEITEYRYTSEIRAIELDPGKAYTVAPGTILYGRPPAEAKESLKVAFPEALQISAYYGDKATETAYRPLRTELPDGKIYPRLLASTAGLLFLAFALLSFRWGREALDWSGATPEELELRRLQTTLARFADQKWVSEADPRTRMKQLEGIVVHASPILMGLRPHELWNGHVDDAWSRVSKAMCAVYMPGEPGYEHVEEGRQALADAFAPVLTSLRRRRR